MAIQRQPVGDVVPYRGRWLRVAYMGPDLLGYVDYVELSGFFLTVEAAIKAGKRYVDDEIKAEQDKARKAGDT